MSVAREFARSPAVLDQYLLQVLLLREPMASGTDEMSIDVCRLLYKSSPRFKVTQVLRKGQALIERAWQDFFD